MRMLYTCIIAALMAICGTQHAHAQYYEIANQIPGLLRPALSGSLNYKGYVEAYGVTGIGNNKATFIGLSTSQGFKYSSWFFMGVGLGVDLAVASKSDNLSELPPQEWPDWKRHTSYQTKCMIPVFTDFRFNLGSPQSTSFFIDVKVGAAWLIGNGYLSLENGSLTNGTQFYLQPTLGVRIPVSKDKPNRAFNIGVTYRLLTSDNYYSWNNNSVTLNNLGATIGYEW